VNEVEIVSRSTRSPSLESITGQFYTVVLLLCTFFILMRNNIFSSSVRACEALKFRYLWTGTWYFKQDVPCTLWKTEWKIHSSLYYIINCFVCL